MRRGIIRYVDEAVPLCGRVLGTPWAKAQAIRVDRFPWYSKGRKQSTTVRTLYGADCLFLQFRCRDRHSSAKVIDLNGPVCRDSCVEFFATVRPERAPDYVNLEVNCCGTLHVGYGPDRHGRRLIGPAAAGEITVATSVSGPVKEESPADRSWWVAVRLPFTVIESLSGETVRPRAGDRWRGNFYRCGGRTDDQYACWNPVVSPAPDYHRPECFGELHFV